MHRVFLVATVALFALASCKPIHTSMASHPLLARPLPMQTSIPLNINTSTVIFSATAPLETPTAVATPACDISSSFCILDGHFFFQRPILPPNRVTAENSYLFGSTENGKLEPHHGVDLPNATGTAVMAAAGGTVVFAGSDMKNLIGPYTDFYGNVIIIQHSFTGIQQPVYSLYGHLSQVDVGSGQVVQAGDVIGQVGSTGIAMGSHLHFEVRVGENSYTASSNPDLWLIPLDGTGVIAGRVVDMDDNLLYVDDLRIQYYPSDVNHVDHTMYLETYGPEKEHVLSDAELGENFAVGDLAAGKYKVSFEADYLHYERWVEVQAGKISYMKFVVK